MSLIEAIPEEDALGPAVITLFLDDSPLPSKVQDGPEWMEIEGKIMKFIDRRDHSLYLKQRCWFGFRLIAESGKIFCKPGQFPCLFGYLYLLQESVTRLMTRLSLNSVESHRESAVWHRNTCIVVGNLAEKMAGVNSASIFTTTVLNYLLENLVTFFEITMKIRSGWY